MKQTVQKILSVVGIFITAVLILGVPEPSEASGIPNKAIAQEAYQKLLGMGATHEVSSAILGNAFKESTINTSATATDAVKNYIDAGGDFCTPSGLSGPNAAGMFQWAYERRDAMLCKSQTDGVEWDSVDSQLEYAFKTEMAISDPFKESAYGAKALPGGGYCQDGVDCSDVRASMPGGVSDFFKGTSIDGATMEFLAYWERPGFGESDPKTRIDMAYKIYEEFKDLDPIDLGVTVSEGSSEESSSTTETSSSDLGGIVKEEDLTGMDSFKEREDMRSEMESDSNTIKDATLSDLSAGDQYSVANIRENIALQQMGIVHTAQVVISLIGMLVMVWGVLLFAGMLFDKTNNFFEFQMTRMLSFGRLEYAVSEEDISKTALRGRQISVRALGAVFVGLFIVSGTFYGWTLDIITLIQDLWG